SWITFGRLIPGVRTFALKNALGGVAAISAAAESISARTYGSASERPTYVGAVMLYVLIGICWYDWSASPNASALRANASARMPLRVPGSNCDASATEPASRSSAVRTVRYTELNTLSAIAVPLGTAPCSASDMETSATDVDANSSVTRPAM